MSAISKIADERDALAAQVRKLKAENRKLRKGLAEARKCVEEAAEKARDEYLRFLQRCQQTNKNGLEEAVQRAIQNFPPTHYWLESSTTGGTK